jgi:hypothetical protein
MLKTSKCTHAGFPPLPPPSMDRGGSSSMHACHAVHVHNIIPSLFDLSSITMVRGMINSALSAYQGSTDPGAEGILTELRRKLYDLTKAVGSSTTNTPAPALGGDSEDEDSDTES